MNKRDPYLRCPDQTVVLHGIRFPLEYLFRGLLVTGQPGSGKTRCILMPLILDILRATGNESDSKAGLIIADPKDELAPFMADALEAVGRKDDLVLLRPGSGWYNPLFNPFLNNEGEMVEKISSLAENTSRKSSAPPRDHAYWENAQRNLLNVVLAATRAEHGQRLTFDLLNRTLRQIEQLKTAVDASSWASARKLPGLITDALVGYVRLPPDTTRPCVTSCVSNCLHFWNRQPLAQLTTPSEDLPEINPFDIVDQGKILVIGCAGAAFGVSITPLLLALKEHFFTTLLSRDQIEVQGGDTWRPINQTRPVFFIADEFQSYLSPNPTVGELTALDRLRGFNAGYLAATQNLASLHSVLGHEAHAIRLISLFANQIYLSNICPMTATQAGHILGTMRTRERQRELRPRMAPPHLFRVAARHNHEREDVGLEVTRTEPRVTAARLANMKTGEFWFRLASGKVIRGRSPQPNAADR